MQTFGVDDGKRHVIGPAGGIDITRRGACGARPVAELPVITHNRALGIDRARGVEYAIGTVARVGEGCDGLASTWNEEVRVAAVGKQTKAGAIRVRGVDAGHRDAEIIGVVTAAAEITDPRIADDLRALKQEALGVRRPHPPDPAGIRRSSDDRSVGARNGDFITAPKPHGAECEAAANWREHTTPTRASRQTNESGAVGVDGADLSHAVEHDPIAVRCP